MITSTDHAVPPHTTTGTTTAIATKRRKRRSVQLHDIVLIDWIGYYCNDTTKRQLNIPTSTTTTTTSSSSTTCNTTSSLSSSSLLQQCNDNDRTEDHNSNNNHENSKLVSSSISSVSIHQPTPPPLSLLLLLDTLPIFHTVNNFYCCVGDQDVIPAVEMGLRFMDIQAVMSDDEDNDNDDATQNHTVTAAAAAATDNPNDPSDFNPTSIPTVALIYSHSKYAYGLSSRTYTHSTATDGTNHTSTYTLPPESNVLYKVTLQRIVSSSSSANDDIPDPKLLLQCYQCKKLLANDIFQNDILTKSKHSNHDTNVAGIKDPHALQNYSTNGNDIHTNMYHLHRAIRIYQRTVEKLENLIIELQQSFSSSSSPIKEGDKMNDTDETNLSYINEAKQLQIDCLNNISAVYMKCQLYHKAKEACIQTLLKDSNNSKALFRAARAALYDPASSYDEVQATLHAVQQELVHTPPQSVQLQKDLEILQKEYQQHEMKYKQQQKIMATRIQKKMNHAPSMKTSTTKATSDSKQNTDDNEDMDYDHVNNVTLSTTTSTGAPLADHVHPVVACTEPSSTATITTVTAFLRSVLSSLTSRATKRILYRMVQGSLLFFLLLYMYIYVYITTTTTTTLHPSSTPPQLHEL